VNILNIHIPHPQIKNITIFEFYEEKNQ